VTFAEGTDGVLLSLKRSANAATTYNGVIATGEGTSAEDRGAGEAWDEEPTSPTYRYGEYGQVPRLLLEPVDHDGRAGGVRGGGDPAAADRPDRGH